MRRAATRDAEGQARPAIRTAALPAPADSLSAAPPVDAWSPAPPPRSFWAEEDPGAGGHEEHKAPVAPSFADAARDAERAAARALLSGAAADLDVLALALQRVLGATPEASRPALLEGMRSAGLQLPDDGSEAMMVSPSRHDVASLLVELQGRAAAAATLEPSLASASAPGLRAAVSQAEGALATAKRVHASAPGGAEPEQVQLASAALRYRRLELEVAELKQQLTTRPPVSGPTPVSPRFSQMAMSIVRREEQLQRAKASLRSQRAQTATELEVVRRQLAQYAPNDRVHAALRRMERAHVQSAQRWEYRREQLLQARSQLLEQALSAFKIVTPERPASPSGENQRFSSLYLPTAPTHGANPAAPTRVPSRLGPRRGAGDDMRPITAPHINRVARGRVGAQESVNDAALPLLF